MTWSTFGDPNSFAIQARLVDDPAPRGGPEAYGWSYGDWRLFVRGRSLTRHTRPNGEIRDEVRWYLGPLLQWLGEVWSPFFHEQRPPASIGGHENLIVAFEQGERILLDDEGETARVLRSEMQDWRRRHSVWAGSAGGIFPNIWFRRQSDLMEISYDPGPTVGSPAGLEFQFNRGAALIDVGVVASAMSEWLQWGRNVAESRRHFNFIPVPSAGMEEEQEAENWFMGKHLSRLLRTSHKTSSQEMQFGVLHPLSPEVAMFGTLTPNLSEEDATILLLELDAARTNRPEPSLLSELSENRAPPSRDAAWEEGYELALETHERIGGSVASTRSVDIDKIINTLGVNLRYVSVKDQSLRGVAIAGPGFTPTVIVNQFAKWNKTKQGLRFTIAHELAHILSDRGSARTITHSSTPWAPETIERRANAFAAMFLMPYRLVDAALHVVGPIKDVDSLTRVARRLECGKSAVLEHLQNIDRIDRTIFFRMKAELARP
ncbi:ImmA/IrrE family metallo-endopeptidase [Methylosinus sp. R-45379]|uniref:ImmA/IrrE family metallo-endopeptidase n=1 Tax=Methylosinus sp. R-45379 TaxID=980563 RepID=UPI000A01C2D3|nr:ImmA/IrrE family metallo-endopeptidase [Methylosinus sp. R-45379]